MKKILFGVFVFLAPSLVLAAGFAKQSIFLSTATPVEGQSVLIYASVSNPAATTFTGTLLIKDEASEIGSVPVSLKAGGADNVSVSWKPNAGNHTIVAVLKDSSGSTLEENKETFSIAANPSSSTASNSSTPFNFSSNPIGEIQSSAPIQESISSVSPAVAEYTAPVLSAIDSGRTFTAEKLTTALDWSKSKAATTSTAGKTSSKEEKSDSLTDTGWSIFATIVLYIVTILLYIVTNVGVFYPLLAVLFLYTLWRLWRKYRRGY